MSVFSPKDKLKYALEQRWSGEGEQEFPDIQQGLIEKYDYIEKFLNEKHHPNVTLGAAIAGDGLLTDHGVEHVQMVMKKAADVLGSKIDELKGYEIFLLLLAIHFHDVGNIYGREDHEQKIGRVIDELDKNLPLDYVEQRYVIDIATAHGGYSEKITKDKDTLRKLEMNGHCNGMSIRPALLAAILRFADELADDISRCSNVMVPKENEVFHAYSESLEPIFIDGETISFRYRIPYEYTQKRLGKKDDEVFLYDEIKTRLAKCMRELEYCRKYAGDYIGITTINVKICIMEKDSTRKCAREQSFRLRLLGYPEPGCTQFENFLEGNQKEDFSNGTELKNAMAGGVSS